LAVEIDDRRLRSRELSDVRARADCRESPVRNRDRLCNRESRIDGYDVAVDENRVRRRSLSGRIQKKRGKSDNDGKTSTHLERLVLFRVFVPALLGDVRSTAVCHYRPMTTDILSSFSTQL